jgi:hypothetical protein
MCTAEWSDQGDEMQRKMTRAMVPLTAAAAAAMTAGTCAWSQSGPSTPQREAVRAKTECPATPIARPPAPARDPLGDGLGLIPPLRMAVPLRVALTAHTRSAAGNLVHYRIHVGSAQGALHGITVTARLTCLPGDARLVGRPTTSAGRATAERQALVWRLDLDKASETATFAVRVRPGDRGGPLVGEVTTTGPMSNCPAHRDGAAPVDPACRATVQVSPRPAPAAHPVTPTPAAHPPAVKTPAAMPSVPGAAMPSAPGAAMPSAPGAAVPALPAPAVPALPVPTPSQNQALSQVDRAPLIPSDSGSEAAAQPAAPEVAQPDTVVRSVLRSADYSQDDLSGRAFAFLLGGVAFLLIAAVAAGRLVAVGLRQREPRTVTEK